MTTSSNKHNKKGDTVIEVIFATTIFGLIAVISISLMNSGISTAQTAVELTLARNEIDAQAEALRFIQNGFAAERENNSVDWQFDDLWDNLTGEDGSREIYNATSNNLPDFHTPQLTTSTSGTYQQDGCANAMQSDNMKGAFILNTREITLSTNNHPNADPSSTDLRERSRTYLDRSITNYSIDTIIPTPLYPRIIYGTATDINTPTNQGNEKDLQETQNYNRVLRSEGLWVLAVKSQKTTYSNIVKDYLPDYYDFHIRACWYAPASAIPSTIGTVVRLYNPRVLE